MTANPSSDLPTGVYEHHKGQQYLVLGVARHSETEEELVVYVRLYRGEGGAMFVRPRAMFTDEVRPGVPRFRHLG